MKDSESTKPIPHHLTDLQLLDAHMMLAAQGNVGSQARVDYLKRKLGISEHAYAAE